MSNTRMQKRLLEKQRQERAAAKRARRQGRAEESTDPAESSGPPGQPAGSQEELLAALAELHRRFEDEEISLEELEEGRAELVDRLHID